MTHLSKASFVETNIMRLRRMLFLCRYWIVRLLIRGMRFLIICILIVTIYVIAISLANGVEHWRQYGDFQDPSLSIFLQKHFIILPQTNWGIAQSAIDGMVRLPAMFLGLLIAIASFILKKLLDRTESKLRRHKMTVADRTYLIQKIEHKLR